MRTRRALPRLEAILAPMLRLILHLTGFAALRINRNLAMAGLHAISALLTVGQRRTRRQPAILFPRFSMRQQFVAMTHCGAEHG
jgi:hypothetical protein